MLQKFRAYSSLFLLVSIISIMLSSVPHFVYEGLHTVSYQVRLFEKTSHYELHEQCIEHEHDVLDALKKSKEPKRSNKKPYPSTKLQKINETLFTLHLSGIESRDSDATFCYLKVLSDRYLETLGEPPEAVF